MLHVSTSPPGEQRMWLVIIIVLGVFVSAAIWLLRHWNATGPTDLWRDEAIDEPQLRFHADAGPARPDPHAEVPLAAIGYWSSDVESGWPQVSGFQDAAWDPNEREVVRAHLDRGTPLAGRDSGVSICVVCGSGFGPAELTDGTYVWPGCLAHQVAEHDVRLPGLFVLHARTTAQEPRDPIGFASSGQAIDIDWWRSQQAP